VKILVTGGTGFVGPRVVHALRAERRDVRALVRAPDRASQLASWGVELAHGDVNDPSALAAAMTGCTRVIHLVAILKGSPADFDRVMVKGTANVVAAAKEAGVERLLLMSALGTTPESAAKVPYYAAKLAMEREVAGSGLEHVILRPSFVFGRGGGALQTFVRQVRYSPLVTVIGDGRQRSQPIWIEDVAAYFARAVDLPAAANRTFELGGPDVVSWDELYALIARVLSKHRALVHVPFSLARIGARATERLPGAPITVDQVSMLQGEDNVVSNDDAGGTFGLPLVSLEDQIRRAI
jgi:NADH dehydrogenase